MIRSSLRAGRELGTKITTPMNANTTVTVAKTYTGATPSMMRTKWMSAPFSQARHGALAASSGALMHVVRPDPAMSR